MSVQPLTSDRFQFDDAGEAVEFFFRKGWTDGLPVVPPTVERVGEFLDYAGRSPSEIVGSEPTKGRVVTAEKAAINAVMAGCLPEYFPVVVAAVEAISEPEFNLHAVSVSTMGAAIVTVVNGPIIQEIGLNSGVGAFGPGNRANATIGRALRLIVTNATGAEPGVLDKSTFGHPGKYTWCVAEAEEATPWAPLHVERGFAEHQSTVTVFAGLSPIRVGNPRDGLVAAGHGQRDIIVVLSPESVGPMVSQGLSKSQVKQSLYESTIGERADAEGELGVTAIPDDITLIVAGGAAGASSVVIPIWGGGSNTESVTKEIRTPSYGIDQEVSA